MDSFNEERHVLVIGSAGIDVKGRPDYGVTPGISTPGRIRSSMGGVARNIAENLARLEVPTWLLSAVGTDSSGEHILTSSSEAGIHMERVLSVPEARTGHYMALLTPEGELDTAVSDYAITEHITPAYLEDNADLFEMASLVVIDANLSAETLRTVFALAGKHDVPVCADPTAPSLANRLRPYLNRIHLITPNLAEADVLCEQAVTERDADAAIAVAQTLVERGVRIAVITLGVRGLVYVSGSDRGQIPAIPDGDSGRDRRGRRADRRGDLRHGQPGPPGRGDATGDFGATLTLRSRETVVKELSQELLYDQLVI
jgi:pseudouridine kinase